MSDNRKFIVEVTLDEIKEIVFCDSLSLSTRVNFFMVLSKNIYSLQGKVQVYTGTNNIYYITKDVHSQIKNFIIEGEWIRAIKLLREKLGINLKETKDAIDIYAQKNDWPCYKGYLKPYSKGF